jgi:hypothetical protein
MNKLGLSALICVLCATAACSRLREPTDAQLGALLIGERANPADVNTPLSVGAIECMRSWSGDADLLKGLSMRVAGEDGQKTCRGTLDGLLADTARNPDKFSFEDITAPKIVRRAVELQKARRAAATTAPQQIPPALVGTNPVANSARAPDTLAAPDPNVELGVSGSELQEAEQLCLQTQQAATDPQAKDGLKKFAAFCMRNLRTLRNSMENSARHGQGQERLAAIAVSATNLANAARQVLAEGKK